jgi:hypothetical protein
MSDVARLKTQILMEEIAAQHGLNGFAAVAQHASIIVRMEQMTEQLRELYVQGKNDEAKALLKNDDEWNL